MGLRQAVILAGGRGTRLYPLTKTIPKPLALVNGRPFVDYLIDNLVAQGIESILFLIGYKGLKIVNYLKNDSRAEISFSNAGIDVETGDRLLYARQKLDDHFLLLYGDNYSPLDLRGLYKKFLDSELDAMMTVFSNKNGTGEYGNENNVEYNNAHRLKRYDPTRRAVNLNGVNIGFFVVKKKILERSTRSGGSFESAFVAPLVSKGRIAVYPTDQQYYYITDIFSLRRFEKEIRGRKI